MIINPAKLGLAAKLAQEEILKSCDEDLSYISSSAYYDEFRSLTKKYYKLMTEIEQEMRNIDMEMIEKEQNY